MLDEFSIYNIPKLLLCIRIVSYSSQVRKHHPLQVHAQIATVNLLIIALINLPFYNYKLSVVYASSETL